MDARAPAVVAVLVTRDPGPWFEVALAALAAQDYEEMVVLVLVSGGSTDPTAQLAAVLPDAFVRRLEEDRGFGSAANEALGMVEGAAFYLLCHDDCAPDPGALHLLVEESYRSNAGIVTPKMVRWDDPSLLLHVGMSADKTGAVVERVQSGEVDHGQHDAVRDVFVAPGGFTLIRADLFEELGGFDTTMVAMGEDLDLSWRAQVAGARVVVAPDARVRHREAVAGELRPVADGPDGAPAPSLQVLERRHELRAVLKCYSVFHLVRVLPQAAVLALAEIIAGLAARDRQRARAVIGAWGWNFARLGDLRRLRRVVKAHRTVPDGEVRRLQINGSARLSTYLSRLAHQGFDVAHGRTPSTVESAAGDELEGTFGPVLTGSVGLAFSEDADFDELDDLGHRSGRDRFGRRRRRPALSSGRSRLIAWALVALVLIVGSRDLFARGLPLVGQFLPLPNWSATWSHLVSGWQSPGVGTTAPASPAFGVLGVLGTVLFGGMGLVQKVLVLGCIPLGAWGVSRFLAPLCSPRARLVGAVCYLGLPLSYNALAEGRWDGLVAYAAVPWILIRLARASGLAPFVAVPPPSSGVRWTQTIPGQMLTLGVIEAVAISFAPAVAPVIILCALGIVVGSVLVGESGGSWRAVGVAAGATVVAAVLCGPWVMGTVLAGHSALGVFGLAGSTQGAPSWSELLRFAVGPAGSSPLSWLLLVAALLPLLIGRQARLAWAGRLWTVAVLSWVLALAVARGWTGSFAPSVDVLLVPAAAAVACGVGLGVSAFETDLSGYRFGWRQLVTVGAVTAALLGMLPVVAEAGDGRWGLPATGYGEPLSFMAPTVAHGSFRVLWLGDPPTLPIGGWSIAPGLAYATSEDGTPDAVNLWSPAGPGPASTLGRAVELARSGSTSHLGRLLAPAGVRYIAVISNLAPVVPGVQQPAAFPPPADLLPALLAQDDLQQVPGGGQGFTLFENTEYVPIRAERATGPIPPSGSAAPWPTPADVTGWGPVLPGPRGARSYSGPATAGTVLASDAPAGRWHLSVGRQPTPSRPAFGWAIQYNPVPAGSAELAFAGDPLVPLSVLVMLALWLVVAAALLGRRRWLDWWFQPMRHRRRPPRHAASGALDEGSPAQGLGGPAALHEHSPAERSAP
jgi:GT2 family glycosyltransferase